MRFAFSGDMLLSLPKDQDWRTSRSCHIALALEALSILLLYLRCPDNLGKLELREVHIRLNIVALPYCPSAGDAGQAKTICDS